MPIKSLQRNILLSIALLSNVILLGTCSSPSIAQDNDARVTASSSCVEYYPSVNPPTGLAASSSDSPTRQRYRPVTLTQEGWRMYGPTLLYSGWRYAFSNFSFYGNIRRNYMLVGYAHRISIDGTTSNITRLISSMPQTGPSGCLTRDYSYMPRSTEAGALAGEVIALTLNVAFNDMRIMPRHPGYDLEKFTISRGQFRGYTVGRVLDIANRMLGGDIPMRYGLANYQALTDILRQINSNYEFINYNTFIERGYLVMNRTYGQPDPPHNPRVP